MPPTPEYCFLWIDWWPFCLTKGEWSGWVQAIGSIGAIFVAIEVARRQTNHALALQNSQQKLAQSQTFQAYLEFLVNVRQLVASVMLAAVRLRMSEQQSSEPLLDRRRRALGELEAIRDALKRTDISRLDRYEYIDAVCTADAQARWLITCICEAQRGTAGPEYVEQCARATETHVKQYVDNLLRSIETRRKDGPMGAE